MKSLKEFAFDVDKIIVAHRGASGDYPENTMIAINEAIKQGAKLIEVDIQFTLDDEIIIYHDDKLGRIAEGNQKISQLKYFDLKNLDAGSWFDKKFSNQRIPLLSDVLNLIQNKAYLLLEIKTYKDPSYTKKFNKILELIESFDYLDKTLFASFDYNFLHHLKTVYQEINTAAIKIPGKDIDAFILKEKIDYDAYICSYDEVNKDLSEYLSENEIIAGIYGVDSIEIFNKIKDYDIKAYGTNYPELLINLIKDK